MSHLSARRWPRRGEVWLTEFDPVRGHEQGGTRPAVVLSVDPFNRASVDLVAVVPITSRLRQLRSRVRIQPPEGGIAVESDVLCEQFRIITHARLLSRWGQVSDTTMNQIGQHVTWMLGLSRSQ